MASSDLDLNNIAFQANLRSKIVKENFTDIQNDFNSLRAEVYATIASTASEITSARDNFGNLTDNIHVRRVYNNRVVDDADYLVSPSAGLVVSIAAGDGIVNGVGVTHNTSGTASVSAPAAGKTRMDVVVINTDNTRTIEQGGATTATAAWPAIADTQMPVARWIINDTTATLSADHLIDLRIVSINPFNDFDLYDKQYTYDGNFLVTDILATDKKGNEFTFDVSYTGSLIATIGVGVDTNRYTASYSYDANDNITNKTIRIT